MAGTVKHGNGVTTMDDLSVIRSKNNKASKEADIASIKATGRVVLVRKRIGIDDIAGYRVFDTKEEARAAAVSLDGIWHIA